MNFRASQKSSFEHEIKGRCSNFWLIFQKLIALWAKVAVVKNLKFLYSWFQVCYYMIFSLKYTVHSSFIFISEHVLIDKVVMPCSRTIFLSAHISNQFWLLPTLIWCMLTAYLNINCFRNQAVKVTLVAVSFDCIFKYYKSLACYL